MLDRYIEKGGKRLRYGYTTGSCAAAAAKAALTMLLGQRQVTQVDIDTPKGWPLTLEVCDAHYSAAEASCAVVKDAGDDPDITDGIKIFATVRPSDKPLVFKGGVGVGTVTLKGLSLPVGEPAINPVPREMIAREMDKVKKEYGVTGGYEVEISIPEGVELAKRTFNPKLGILGGLSVAGTSGIVEPMSEEALKESMRLELSMLRARGEDRALFVPGNYGKDYAEALGLNLDLLVKTSNFIGFMLEEAERLGFKKILFVGHLGKLVKVAGGLFNTHSAVADGRMEILAANAALLGGSQALVQKIMASTTTDEAAEYLLEANIPGYFDHLAKAVKARCQGKVYNNIDIEVIIFSKAQGHLGESAKAKEMMEELCIH
ncbi:MAG: cobalt-precorrin-5B (C(1))-methyltransferase CbiD [Eubacterium sp.]|nr:cobalt-precorrin-5B (C(1))-methyltransferase CbiD [Eubacterium sp.]